MKNKAFFVIVGIIVFVACQSEKKEIVEAIVNRAKTPMMHADSVTTIISDSGVTRYRISTPVWDYFDKDSVEPYWDFPQGIRFERFNTELKVDANISANYARNRLNQQLWELRGNVRATNIEGTVFLTEQMFWNQRSEKIYSDSLVTVIQPDGQTWRGKNGFEANQQLTKYVFKNADGKVPVAE